MTDQPVVGEPAPSGASVPPARPWGLGDAAAGFFAALFLSTLLATVYVGVTGEDDLTLGRTIVGLAGYWTALVGCVVLASRRKGSGRLAADFGLRVERRDVWPGVLAGVLSQLVLLPLLYLPLDLLGFDLDVSEEARSILDRATGPGLVVLSFCVVIGAPLAEELFFRGLLQRAAQRRFGPQGAVAFSAVVFGVTHFQPVQLLGLIAFGVVLGVLAQRAGRLGPALVAHIAFNATTVVWLVATR